VVAAEDGVGVRDTSGVGDLVRQFLSHKSGVMRFSTSKNKKGEVG
jgi:hypothetical protein